VVVALAEQPPGGWVNVPAQAEIVLGEQVDSVAVPERCVRTSTAGQSFVYVRGQSGRIFRQVELGVIQDDRVQIRSGLEAGQTVICQSGR
jgi:multidrug efflux pump subunit AcrA (membrane-fusion protein)